MAYILYFALVLLVLPALQWVFLKHGESLKGAFGGVYFLFGVLVYFAFRMLAGNVRIEWWVALPVVFMALWLYDRLFAVKFQEWIEGDYEE